jgi:hypothetical protein
MTFQKIVTYLFVAISLIFEGFFGVASLVGFVWQVILLSLASLFLVWIIRRKSLSEWKNMLYRYSIMTMSIFGFLTTVSLGFFQYQHSFPGVISDITLSHSWQQVIFIQMSHIATPEFYQSKHKIIQTLAQSGYTILTEWVRPGTPENQKKFDQALGFTLTHDLYGEVASLIGLQSQDNRTLYAGISTGSLRSVDLSIDDIVWFLGTGSLSASGSSLDISSLSGTIALLTPRERTWLSWVARWVLSYSLKYSSDMIQDITPTDPTLWTSIIDRRNDAIVDYIRNHPTENIVIVYGALHFNWVYGALQKIDPNWKIVDIKNQSPYQY